MLLARVRLLQLLINSFIHSLILLLARVRLLQLFVQKDPVDVALRFATIRKKGSIGTFVPRVDVL